MAPPPAALAMLQRPGLQIAVASEDSGFHTAVAVDSAWQVASSSPTGQRLRCHLRHAGQPLTPIRTLRIADAERSALLQEAVRFHAAAQGWQGPQAMLARLASDVVDAETDAAAVALAALRGMPDGAAVAVEVMAPVQMATGERIAVAIDDGKGTPSSCRCSRCCCRPTVLWRARAKSRRCLSNFQTARRSTRALRGLCGAWHARSSLPATRPTASVCVSARLRLRLVTDEVLQSQSSGGESMVQRAPELVQPFLPPPLPAPPVEELRRQFKGKLVFVGTSDPRLGDMHRTAVGDLPGVFVHANAMDTLQRGLQPLPSPWLNAAVALALPVLPGFAFTYLPPFFATKFVVSAVAVGGAWLAGLYFQQSGVFINVWAPIANMAVLELLYEVQEWWRERKQG